MTHMTPLTTILVVEDDPAILEAISFGLGLAGHAVLTAANGREGLDRLHETTPDLVLSDITMPVMDGYDFYRRLRANPDWELLPFVFITASCHPQEIREGMRLGVDDYLPKPFEVQDVLDVIETRVGRARSFQQAAQHGVESLKSRIFTLLNHEFRTPLNQIIGYVDLVEMDGTDLDTQTLAMYLDGLKSGSHRLMRVIEDLLMTMEIESGWAARAYETRKENLKTLADLIARVAGLFQPQAAEAKVTLRVQMPPSLPPVEADTTFLGDALSRLIDNSIKFSQPGGSVAVRAAAHPETDSVTITVTDEGPGIQPDEHTHIFDVFYQVERERHEQQGLGIGLTIARGLVELHGGTIEVDSEVGSGSTFRIILPLGGE